MQLYSMPSSGNSYKVRLMLALTGRKADIVHCEHGSDNLPRVKAGGILPYGKLPALVLDDGQVLAESNAILWYLGEGTGFIPSDPVGRAQMLGWMFWEQYTHEPVIAVRQSLISYPHRAAGATPERLADLLTRGYAALEVMENHLKEAGWLTGGRETLADLCLYAYTHTAESRGGYDMGRFPAIRQWLGRVQALPGYTGKDQ